MEAQQSQGQGTPYGLPNHNLGSNIVFLTNPTQGLADLEMTYRGEKMLPTGKTISVGLPQMNELGIGRVMGQVRSIVDQVTILGFVNEQHLCALWDMFNDTLVKDLMMHSKDYGITSSVGRDVILSEASNKVWTCLLRSFNEGDRKFWSKVTQEIKQVSDGQRQQSALSRAMGWMKGE